MQRVLDNPRTGERFVIRCSGSDTGGELLLFDLYLEPGGHVPAGHVHPRQEERFSVIDGRIRFRLPGRTLDLGPGASVVVPSGRAHWFGNQGDTQAHVRVEVRPALRMEELFETSVTQASSNGAWCWRLVDRVLMLLEYQHEVGVPHVPAWIVTVALTPLAWLRTHNAR